jgi:hypothetical protein
LVAVGKKQETGRQNPSPGCINAGFCQRGRDADERQYAILGAFCHRSFANGCAAAALASGAAFAAERSYELTARLELPHLERWGVDKTTIICLSNSRGSNEIPVPVVSANNPFAKCSATNLTADGTKLEYDIVCPERGSAKGHAVYEVSSDAFTGHIAMVMGAKNMTMTEVQRGRRIGECSPAKLGSAQQF